VAFLSSLLVFLSLNFPNKKRPAKIFMGDAGSLLLGFVIAWFAIRFSQSSFSHPVTFLWITAIPLFDFFAVTIGRIRHGRSPLRSDRQHIHHILQDKGFKPPHIVIGLAFASLCLSATGIALTYSDVSDSLSFMLFLCLLIPYILAFGIFRTAAAVA
jgi:UDP-GlcNAc:undecaprenyl-phosphate GlcNAc-1-phosphate transferase